MSNYSTITSLGESPVQDGILYVGTDDGLIHVTTDGGSNWKLIEVGSINGIPATAFVNDIRADLFDANTVYAALDNHKYGDFRPYIMKSSDAGSSWKLISGTIDERTLVWRLVQDHVRKDLLFAATEFGIWFTVDGGEQWTRMKGGLPTISFRDIQIQRREDDLVGASFGRGFYILDDLSPLRELNPEMLKAKAKLFPVKDAWLYIPRGITVDPGASEYRAENPPFGATFTYYLKEDLLSLKEVRKDREKKLNETESDIPFPGWDAVEAEHNEDAPVLVFAVKDEKGKVINHVKAPAKKGVHRVNWDLRHASRNIMDPKKDSVLKVESKGYMVTPGVYSVSLYALNKGEVDQLAEAVSFEVLPLHDQVLEPATPAEIEEFRKALETAKLEYGAVTKVLQESSDRLSVLKNACFRMEDDAGDLLEEVYRTEADVLKLQEMLNGKQTVRQVGEQEISSLGMRWYAAEMGLSTSYGPTTMHKESLQMGIEELNPIREQVRTLKKTTLPALEEKLRNAGAPIAKEL
jgi:hypothetical protein